MEKAPQPLIKTLLPSAMLFAAALLLIACLAWPGHPARLPGSAVIKPPSKITSPVSRTSRPVPPPKLGPEAARLTADVFCAHSGKPLPVGSHVMLTALADADPGRAVTLVLSCRKGQDPASLLSLAEGRLCSVAWTPTAPGRYLFTATASDDRARAIVSRPLLLTVTGPLPVAALPPPVLPASVRPLPALPAGIETLPALPPMSYAPPPQSVRLRLARLPVSRPLSPPTPPEPITPAASPNPSTPKAASPALYHVVVATFPAARNAVVLAKSFWGRGVRVAVRHRIDSRGREAYVVEMAASHSQGTAQQSALSLQRSGYPAYCFEGQ